MDSQKEARSRRKKWLGVVISVLLSACSVMAPQASPALLPTPTATVAPSMTPMQAASETPPPPTLAPTATPVVFGDSLADVAFALPLTVRHVTNTSATLFFELTTPSAEGILVYELADGEAQPQQSVPLDPAGTRQQIILDGLVPGVEHQAVVGLWNKEAGSYQQPAFMGQVWGPVKFHTMSDKQPWRIGVIGDAGFGQPETASLAAEMSSYDLDMVIYTGDIVYNVDENISPYEAFALKFYIPFAPLLQSVPVYTVVGNHDIEPATRYEGVSFYYHAFPPFADPQFPASDMQGRNQWYAVACGDIQFLMLDTQTFFGEEGRSEQDSWLKERLADARFSYTIPVFHVPPYTSGRHQLDGLVVRSEWLPLFEAANVPLVLSGHDHNYERLALNDITYIVTGGGGTTLYPQGTTLPESIVFARRTHFVLLEIYTDRIDLQAIALGGEVIDQTTIPLD